MLINDIISESFLSRIKSLAQTLVQKVTQIVRGLGFGDEQTINLGEVGMTEATKTSNKGGNGRIAEYACAYFLASALKQAGLRVDSDTAQLQQMSQAENAKHVNTMTPEQIQVAVDAGNAMGKSMYESIINKGVDLVFTDYEFLAEQHSFDVEPTGADQGKGSTDDMIIHIRKDGTDQVAHKILLSLKVSATSSSSQGSKSPIPALYKMFGSGKGSKQDFVQLFGAKGQEFVDALEDYKNVAKKEWWNSPEGQKYRQDKIAGGSDPKTYTARTPGGNQLRSQNYGDYYAAKTGQPSEHKLSKLFVELYNQGKINLNQGSWKQFNEGFKQAIGFDEVITYKAICDKQGVATVVNSATSKAYQEMYRALNNKIDVVLTSRPNSSGIGVEVRYGTTVLKSLSCSMWKDGTIQFKFNSAE
jgi:hypothetical protein